MASIKLGQKPKTFKPIAVRFVLPDGTDGEILVTFKYRTRTEMGALVDEMFKDAGKARPDGEQFSMLDVMEKTRDKNADYLAQCIDAWNLDEKLSRDSLSQLADEIPAAASAIMEAYRAAALEGRLGN